MLCKGDLGSICSHSVALIRGYRELSFGAASRSTHLVRYLAPGQYLSLSKATRRSITPGGQGQLYSKGTRLVGGSDCYIDNAMSEPLLLAMLDALPRHMLRVPCSCSPIATKILGGEIWMCAQSDCRLTWTIR